MYTKDTMYTKLFTKNKLIVTSIVGGSLLLSSSAINSKNYNNFTNNFDIHSKKHLKNVNNTKSYNLLEGIVPVSYADVKSTLGETRHFFYPPTEMGTLIQVAEGMRRKNLFVVAVDVYKVGIYLSESQDKAIQKAVSAGSSINMVNRPKCGASGKNAATMGVALHFVRSVTTKQVVDATIEALSKGSTGEANPADYKEALDDMREQLTKGIGANGMKVDEEMQFTFFIAPQGQERVAMVIKDEFVATLEHPLLVKRLAEVYGDINPNTAIAIGVPKQLEDRYKASQ